MHYLLAWHVDSSNLSDQDRAAKVIESGLSGMSWTRVLPSTLVIRTDAIDQPDADTEQFETMKRLRDDLSAAHLGCGFIMSPVVEDGWLYLGILDAGTWDEVNLKSGVPREQIERMGELRSAGSEDESNDD